MKKKTGLTTAMIRAAIEKLKEQPQITDYLFVAPCNYKAVKKMFKGTSVKVMKAGKNSILSQYS